MSDRVSTFTSNRPLPQTGIVPSLTKRAGSKIPVPKVILQLAHKINFRGCKVAPEAPVVLREMSRNKIDPQAVMNALHHAKATSRLRSSMTSSSIGSTRSMQHCLKRSRTMSSS